MPDGVRKLNSDAGCECATFDGKLPIILEIY